MPYHKLFCLFLVCISMSLSGICTLSQERFWTFGVSAQTDSGIRILSFLTYRTSSYFPYFCFVSLWAFQVSEFLVRRGSELIGVWAQTDSGIRISAFLIYPIRSYCAYFWCAPLWDFQVFVLIFRRGSELFGVSAQIDSGIRISAFLIYPTRSYCAYFTVHLSETFKYFYC